MADEPTGTATADHTAEVETAPAPEPVAEVQVQPTPDPVAELRERNARLEGEMAALRAQVVARPQPQAPPPAEWTPELAQQEYEGGRITDAQRIRILASIQNRQDLAQYDAHRRAQDTVARAGDTLQAYMRAYPALTDPNSPLMRQVGAELAQIISEEGGHPSDLRLQLRAVRQQLGALKTEAPSMARQRIPVGSTGTPGSGTDTRDRGRDPLKGIPDDIVAGWKSMGAKLDDPAKKQWYADRYWANEARKGRRQSA